MVLDLPIPIRLPSAVLYLVKLIALGRAELLQPLLLLALFLAFALFPHSTRFLLRGPAKTRRVAVVKFRSHSHAFLIASIASCVCFTGLPPIGVVQYRASNA